MTQTANTTPSATEIDFDFQVITAEGTMEQDETLARYTTKSGAWYTSTLTGKKARGRDAAIGMIAAELEQLRVELEADEEEAPAEDKVFVRTLREALDMEPGKRYWIHPEVEIPSPTGTWFKHDQPMETIICRECGDPRAVHVQDMPQVDERCHPCILKARRSRRNARKRAKREAAKAAQES